MEGGFRQQQVRAISIQDPERIVAVLNDPDADRVKEAIVPLLLDVRTLQIAQLETLTGILNSMNTLIAMEKEVLEGQRTGSKLYVAR